LVTPEAGLLLSGRKIPTKFPQLESIARGNYFVQITGEVEANTPSLQVRVLHSAVPLPLKNDQGQDAHYFEAFCLGGSHRKP
jgi:hypothetical protein